MRFNMVFFYYLFGVIKCFKHKILYYIGTIKFVNLNKYLKRNEGIVFVIIIFFSLSKLLCNFFGPIINKEF